MADQRRRLLGTLTDAQEALGQLMLLSRKPEVAISVLVANHLKWRVKATNVASDMLRAYFASKGAQTFGVGLTNDSQGVALPAVPGPHYWVTGNGGITWVEKSWN